MKELIQELRLHGLKLSEYTNYCAKFNNFITKYHFVVRSVSGQYHVTLFKYVGNPTCKGYKCVSMFICSDIEKVAMLVDSTRADENTLLSSLFHEMEAKLGLYRNCPDSQSQKRLMDSISCLHCSMEEILMD